MSGLVKLTPPEPERDAAVPVIVEENTVKPRKSSLMHHSDNPGPDKLVTPGGSPKGALRKKSVGFRPSSSFEVHVEKAEDAADGRCGRRGEAQWGGRMGERGWKGTCQGGGPGGARRGKGMGER